MLIRPAVAADSDALADAHLSASAEAYAELLPSDYLRGRLERREQLANQWTTLVSNADNRVLVLMDAAELVGFVCTGPRRDQSTATLPDLEVWSIYLRRSRTNRGLGSRLLTEAIGNSDTYLWVLAGNERAVRFYEQHGFVRDGGIQEEPIAPYGVMIEHRMVRARRLRG